ncbi:MAG TPA: hypothetical protein VNU93_04735 [Verrucomicrobiae bacterium]|nr:hypothetical protein [Verrucomicrobiae bacterium]
MDLYIYPSTNIQKHFIKQRVESILGTTYPSIIVLDAQWSESGEHIIVALRCLYGKLDKGAVLSSRQGLQWQVTDNDLRFDSEELERTLRQKEEASIFLYEIKGLGHMERPQIGKELALIQDEN